MLVEAIDKLKAIAPVETFYVRSNHDTQTSYYAASLLDARFYNDPLVNIDTGASPRKYLQYGITVPDSLICIVIMFFCVLMLQLPP